MRKLIAIAACALAAAALPTLAAAGAVHFSETFVDEPTNWFMGEFACDGGPSGVAGTGIESGTLVEMPMNGGRSSTADGSSPRVSPSGRRRRPSGWASWRWQVSPGSPCSWPQHG